MIFSQGIARIAGAPTDLKAYTRGTRSVHFMKACWLLLTSVAPFYIRALYVCSIFLFICHESSLRLYWLQVSFVSNACPFCALQRYNKYWHFILQGLHCASGSMVSTHFRDVRLQTKMINVSSFFIKRIVIRMCSDTNRGSNLTKNIVSRLGLDRIQNIKWLIYLLTPPAVSHYIFLSSENAFNTPVKKGLFLLVRFGEPHFPL